MLIKVTYCLGIGITKNKWKAHNKHKYGVCNGRVRNDIRLCENDYPYEYRIVSKLEEIEKLIPKINHAMADAIMSQLQEHQANGE